MLSPTYNSLMYWQDQSVEIGPAFKQIPSTSVTQSDQSVNSHLKTKRVEIFCLGDSKSRAL